MCDVAIFTCFAAGNDHEHDGAAIPWRAVDGALLWNSGSEDVAAGDQEQGAAAMRFYAGWTCLAWWDRSADERFGSNTAFFAKGRHDFRSMLKLFMAHYPSVAARQPTSLVLKLVATDAQG